MKGKARRLLSWVCVLALCMSLLPVTALAAPTESGTQENPVTNTKNQVTVNKWVTGTGTEDNPYTLTMEAYASNEVTSTTTTKPLDIVLVLDVSGSMDEKFGDDVTYVSTGEKNWSYEDIDDSRNTYYYKVDGSYYEVDAKRDGDWGNRTYSIGYYTGDWRNPIWNQIGEVQDEERDTCWTGTLYTWERTTRLSAMKTAVNTFIDSVNENATETGGEHQIGIVSFSSDARTVKDLTSVKTESNALKNSVNRLSANGSTYVDRGMSVAKSMLDDVNRDSQKVVVVFTDGVPGQYTDWSSDSGRTAADAINAAKGMKDAGVTVYAVGIFEGANPSENPKWTNSSDPNAYMHAMSSNFPNATAKSGYYGYYSSSFTVNNREGGSTANGYYLAASNASGLEEVFKGIADTVTDSTLEVYPDAQAVLTDTLSQYFNFPSELANGNVTADVTAQYVPVKSINGETITWGAAEELPDKTKLEVSVQGDTINIEGFDYVKYAVTQKEDEITGGKLVVSFPIELDEAACGYKGGTYPTNDTTKNQAGLHYKDKQDASQNNASTLLDKSPTVTVDASQVERQGTAIDIKVYVDGQPMSNDEDVGTYVAVTPKDSGSFDEETDKVNYTFTYYDCKDIAFAAQQGYVIEAVDADLVYGQNKCEGITNTEGTVTADNVQGGSTVTVYVRTLYTIQYHGADGNVTTAQVASGKTDTLAAQTPSVARPTDGQTFEEDGETYTYSNVCSTEDSHYQDENPKDDTCDTHAAATADGKQQAYNFTYVADLTTSETIDPLPVDETGEMVYDGWFVGNTDTSAQKISEGENVSNGHDYNFETMDAADGATDNVINLYCTSSAAQYKVTYKLTSTDNPSDASTPPADNQYRYDETVSVAADLTTQETSNDGVPGTWTFSGWTTDDVTVTDGTFKMPAQNVEFTGSWTFTANPTYTVSYQVNGDAPTTFSPTLDELESQEYEGDAVEVAEGLTTEETSKDGVSGTWTFNGWTTDDVEVDDGAFTMPGKDVTFTGSWTFTPNTHTITVEVTNGTAQAEELNDGTSTTKGTITINDNGSVTITFTGNEGYALDTVTVDGSPAVLTTNNEDGSTTYTFSNVKADHNISVVYEEDKIGGENPENPGDGTPDKHQATVTYNVVNGTFGENGPTTKSYVVTTDVYQTTGENAGTWTPLNKHVGDSECSIPTDMTPDSNHVKPGTWGEPGPSNAVQLVGGQTYTYTYTFGTEVEKSLLVTKELTLVDGETYNKSGIVDEGNELTYTITVTNTGNVLLENVTVTDTLTVGDGEGVVIRFNESEGATINENGTATITSLDANDSVKLTATYTVPEGTAGQTISNTAVATSDDITNDPEDSVEVTVANPSVDIVKKLTSATRPGDNEFHYDSDTYKAQVGDELHYTITVKNTGNTHIKVDVTDSLWGNGVNTVYIGASTEGTPVANGDSVTIAMLSEKESQTITYTYTVQASDIGKQNISNTATASTGTEEDDPKDDDTVNVPMDTYTVTITPADMTIYTGGDGYNGVTDEDGNIVEGTENSGLPEPGYHIDLPDAVELWLQEHDVDLEESAANLAGKLAFQYFDESGNIIRNWDLENQGVYSRNSDETVSRYVYSLSPNTVVGENEGVQVRLAFTDDGNIVTTDNIRMDENTVFASYEMTIYDGGLQQSEIKAVFTAGGESITCTVKIGTGHLLVKSVTNEGTTTNGIEASSDAVTDTDTITAVADSNVTYYVNESEVSVPNDRVQLLVDKVSNGEEFNAAMGDDAVDKVNAALGEGNTLSNAAYALAYMDLVDTQNGNTVVTMGENQSLTIYWPVPEDAAENSEFHVVHYYELDREALTDAGELGQVVTPQITTTEVNGQEYVVFETSSFSPFALVYEKAPDPVAKLEVTKTLTKVNDQPYTGGSVSVNDTLTYTITVKNGEVALNNVTITDTFNGKGDLNFTLPNGATVSENQDGIYTINLGNLTAGQEVTITATYKVLRADASSNLVNTAKVTGTNPGDPDTPVTDEVQTPETPVNPYRPPIRPPEDPDKPELNTEDHYAYIVGYEDGSVQPEGDITRAEVATIFFRLLTDESRDAFWSQTNDYTDVPADAWYNNAVSTLTNAGIIDGYEDGTFKPNGNITRAEFATIAVRFFEATYEGENLFPDIDGHWAQDYINEAANAGIVDGYPDGTFGPQKLITRAEAMTMVNRTIDRHPHEDHLLDDMIVWPDNPETAWYYEQVQEATNSHEYTMNTDDEQNPYEIWTKLLPNRDWSELEKEWSDANDGAGSGEVV